MHTSTYSYSLCLSHAHKHKKETFLIYGSRFLAVIIKVESVITHTKKQKQIKTNKQTKNVDMVYWRSISVSERKD